MSFSKFTVYVPFCCATKLNATVLSIIPRSTISATGLFTQTRTSPVVETEPLKVVPEGSTYCNWFDDAERANDGTVVAKAERGTKNAKSKAINTANVSNLVFFIA